MPKAISLLSFVAAGGAYAGGVPIIGAILILIVGVAAAGMTGAAEKFITNPLALQVLQWSVVLVVVAICVALIVEIGRPCTFPTIGKAMGYECGSDPTRKRVVELRGDADRADAAYRSRGEGVDNTARAKNLVLDSCTEFWNVDRDKLPHADLLAEVHLNIARMCSKAAVMLMEQGGNAMEVNALSKRAALHAQDLNDLYVAIKKRGSADDTDLLARSRRNWSSAFYYSALANRLMQCNTDAAQKEMRESYQRNALLAWAEFVERAPGIPPDDKPLIALTRPKEPDPCAP
ncbi:MAG: hypothetical protein SGI99_17790 [Pseudomonadota bacterium]|nr:hypothetical protein [Pseudomonadota bacterium]